METLFSGQKSASLTEFDVADGRVSEGPVDEASFDEA